MGFQQDLPDGNAVWARKEVIPIMQFSGLIDASVWEVVGYTLLTTHITIAAVTIYLHRHQAHRALDLHPAVAHFFRLWLWLTTGMVTRAWVAIHRKHHAKCETPEDPHSPQVLGLKKVLLEGAELYRAAARQPEILEKFGHGTPDDWLERHVYTPHSGKGILITLAVDVLLFGPIGLTVWAVQMLWIPFFAAGVINGIGHYWGYRNYECADASTNIVPWGILIGGEELHNNHHTFASSAKLSSKWWEFDIGWMYIKLLSYLGLAKVKKVAPKPVIGPAKPAVDMDTLRALFTYRFQVMADYTRQVIARVNAEELGRAVGPDRGLLKRARRILAREESLMDDTTRARLEEILARNPTLNTVYQFKVRLKAIWTRSQESQEALLQQLQEWCQQAEATGIQALQEFAGRIRRYYPVPPPATA